MNLKWGAPASRQKIIEITKSLKIATHWTIVILILRSYVDELKRRANSEWTALGKLRVIERTVGEWSRRLSLAFVPEENILSTCINKNSMM